MKTKTLYKFLRTGLKSDNGANRDWKMGEWRKEEGISICNRGFHASQTPLQAFGYVQGEIFALVEVRGDSVIEKDKECFGLIVDSIESIITIDENSKMQVPSLMVQTVRSHFENDIKEIITYKSDEKESILVILNANAISIKIRSVVAA